MSNLCDELMKLILCCTSSFVMMGCCCGLLTSRFFISGVWLISSMPYSTAKPKLNFIKLVNLCERLESGEPLKVPPIISELDFLKLATECKKLVCKKSNSENPSSETIQPVALYTTISIGIISAISLFYCLNIFETRQPSTRERYSRTHRPFYMLDRNFSYLEKRRSVENLSGETIDLDSTAATSNYSSHINEQQALANADTSTKIPDYFYDEIFSVTMKDPKNNRRIK